MVALKFAGLVLGVFLVLFAQTKACLAADELGATKTWVRFDSFKYSGIDKVVADFRDPAGDFLNPILPGFYPDPSVCRVPGTGGDDFYLVNSSFNYFPGIPIFHSKDLVHWTQIGHVLDRPSQFASLKGGDVSRGVYASTIRYHAGLFYVISTLVNGGGNFFVTAKDPAGPWSDPVFLKEVDGIDPSLFFDDNGKAYVVNCAGPPEGRALYDGHRTLRLQEFDPAQGKMIGSAKILVNGGTDIAKKPVWVEGPHIFKRGGKYYLIAAEGGTSTNHSEVVFRADAVDGTYRPFEGNPILTQRQLPANRKDPITCSGHADLVELANGDCWAVFLGCQPYERGLFNTGRETFLLPVNWENDWPVILKSDAPVPRLLGRPKIPGVANAVAPEFSWTDEFDKEHLDFRWCMLRAPASEWFSLKDLPGTLLIAPRAVPLRGEGNPSFLACRQQHAEFSASTVISIDATTAACDAGLAAFQNEGHYFFLGVRVEGGKGKEIFLEEMGGRLPETATPAAPPVLQVLATLPLAEPAARVELTIAGDWRQYRFYYRADNGEFKTVRDRVDGSILSSEVAGGFQGVMLGMYARSRP